MPSLMTISCPACQVKLKLKDDSKRGKSVNCPRCLNPFVAGGPKAAKQDDEVLEFAEADDGDLDFGDLSELQSAPARKSKTAVATMKGKKGSKGRKSGIKDIDDMSTAELREELENGARFVIYQFCISIGIMTFLQPTSIRFIPAGKSSVAPGLPYTFLSLFLGWWGIPWGPIYTIVALCTNLSGGKDVTDEVVANL